MGNDTLSGVRMYGMVPAPLAAQNYKLCAVLVRNSAKRCLMPIGDIESWAAEGCKESAASVLRDIHAACAAWSTDGFMKRVREDAKSSTASVITETYDGKAVKLSFSYYGEESMKAESVYSFTALVEWLAKLRGSSRTKKHQNLHELRQYSLDRGWDPMSWTLNRQRVSCLPCCSDDAPTMYDTPCALLNTRSAALQGIFVVLGQCASILGRYATLCRPYQGSGQETWTTESTSSRTCC